MSSTSRQTAAGRMAGKLLEAVPVAPFLAFGFILAWSQMIHGSIMALPQPAGQPDLPSLGAISTCCNGITLLACGLCLGPAKRLLSSNAAIWAAGIVTGLSGAAAMLCTDAGLTFQQAYPVLALSYGIRGVASALLFLKVAVLYSRLDGRGCIMCLGWSHVLAACLFFIVVGMDEYPLGTSANCASVWLAVVLLPLCAAFLSTLDPDSRGAEGPLGPSSAAGGKAPATEHKTVYSESINTLPSSFWRFVAVILVFSFVMSLSSYLGTAAGGAELNPRLTNFFRILAAFVLVWTALFFDAGRFRLGKAYVVIIVLSIGIVSLCPLAGATVTGWNSLAGIAVLLFRMLHWVTLCLIVCQRRISPILAFGIGAGAQALGSGFGNIIPGLLIADPADPTFALAASVVCVLVVLFCSFILFSEKEMDRLFSPTNPGDVEFTDLFGPMLSKGPDPRAASAPVAEATPRPAAKQQAGQRTAPQPAQSAQSAAPQQAPSPDPQEPPGRQSLPEAQPRPQQATEPGPVPEQESAPHQEKRSFSEAVEICSRRYGLSNREVDVFRYLAMGYNAQAIAEKLFISWNTVRGHSRNIYTKLDVHSRVEVMDLVSRIREE